MPAGADIRGRPSRPGMAAGAGAPHGTEVIGKRSADPVTKPAEMAPSPTESSDRRVGAPMKQHNKTAGRIDSSPSPGARPLAETLATGGNDDVAPIREAVRPWALQALVTTYGGN